METGHPLSFGQQEEEDAHEEVLLDDGPLSAPQPASVMPGAGASSAHNGLGDPLSRAPGTAPGYQDAVQMQQPLTGPLARVGQPQQSVAAGLGGASSAASGSSLGNASLGTTMAAPLHRATPTPDSLEINAEDSSFLRGAGGGGGGAGPSSRPAPALQISVSDPVQRVGDSVIPGFTSTHTEYLVTTTWDSPRRRVEVRRRFRDFVALADLLAITQRGYFVFPRPDKNTLDHQLGKTDFVEVRRLELERYLRKLAAHPVVGQSEELKVFLEAEGSLEKHFGWQQLQPVRGSLLEGIGRLPRQLIGAGPAVPSTVEAQQNARNTSDLLRRFRELGERMRQEYKAPPVLDDQEVQLRERRAGVEEYAEKLAAASRRAERMVKEFEEMGAVMGDLGLALTALAKYEDVEGGRCGQYSDMGVGARAVAADSRRGAQAALRQSRLAKQANVQAMEALEPLHDQLAMSPAMTAALREREAALLTVQSIEEDLERRRRAVGALEESGARRVGGDVTKARKVAALQNEVSALEAAAEAARQEYGRVKSRNLEELACMEQERAADFVRLAGSFAEVHALYGQRCAEIWQAVADDFGPARQLDTAEHQQGTHRLRS